MQIKKYLSKRMLTIFLLGFSSGLPIALVGSVLSAWFKTSGVDIVSIGCLSLIGIPYTYKFLWAPFLDQFELPFLKSWGYRRSWILVAQLLIILLIVLMVTLEPKTNPLLLGFLGLLLAFGSATQDIGIDAYRVNILPIDERGLGAALAVEGYRVAMIVSGWLGFILADWVGWRVTYLIMACFMAVGIITVATIAPTVHNVAKKHSFNLRHTFWQPLEDFLQKDRAIWFLVLIVFYKIGDVCSHALVTPFLLDLDFSLTAIGNINKLVGVAAALIGVMCAGIIMTKVNIFRALLFFGFLQGISNLLYVVLAVVGKNYHIAVCAFFIENLCSGMGNAALTAFLMSLCSKEHAGTQFALFSSLTAMGRVYIGPIAGVLVKSLGWSTFYCISACLAIPGILLILFLKQHIIIYDNRAAVPVPA